MEVSWEAMGSNHCCGGNGELPLAVLKGKRSRRQRALPLPPDLATSWATSAESKSCATEEEDEKDMANCLILLAQDGGALDPPVINRRIIEAATATAAKAAGFYVYECKTCNKCFPSFQALGGHRASHKKPKMTVPAEAAAAVEERREINDEDSMHIGMTNSSTKPIAFPTRSNNKSSRVHECSICGSEFTSGQALGGHMRRHRLAIAPEGRKERSFLSLDLNLPAPLDDDYPELKKLPSLGLTFAAKRPIVFSAAAAGTAAALVDCYY